MTKSQELFKRAVNRIPGGVNSPVRAYGAIGETPRFIQGAVGSSIFDVDGQKYLDYICSWGPMILGHNHPVIRDAVVRACENGLSFGCATEREVEMAEDSYGKFRYGSSNECNSCSKRIYRKIKNH